ncbi:MAG: hypothetical protein EOP38_02420 [Rubrivivax sp.]|nr:MAG: hypothetical protein EOP38_02420 [Rubrivivax sp.]
MNLSSIPRILLVALAITATGMAQATNYTLWINGRTSSNPDPQDPANFTYWGGAPSGSTTSSTFDAGINKISVNWDGKSHVSTTNGNIQKALDCYCTGNNWCYVAVHSAGNLQIGYALSLYGATVRNNTAVPTGGVCSKASGGARQTGWNIKFVDVAAGAAGGSELADSGGWAMSEELVQDLKTSTARAMYDHNLTRALNFYMYAGAKGAITSAVLKGQNDSVVAYHSAGGTSGSSGTRLCNPGQSAFTCPNDLTLGTAANEGGSTKWSFHSVVFRDDAEQFDHYANQNWEGVVSKILTHVRNTAK